MTITITLPVGFRPVLKHGEHDQTSHGSWASGNFDEETEYEGALQTYSERYGVDKNGNKVGVTQEQDLALDNYTSSGYKEINSYLRGTYKVTELDIAIAEDIVRNSDSMYEEALDNYRMNNEVGEELTQSELDDAVYQYATTHGKELLDAYNSGDTLMADNIRARVDAIDSLISESPDLFGDKTLYRVFSDKVLDGLQEGDVLKDSGFLSTTRIDITKKEQSEARSWMGGITKTPDTVGIILPNESKSGKGLAVDIYDTSVGNSTTVSDTEKEVLLPRDTPLKFIGFKTNVGTEARVAVFQRLDK